ncbi:flavin reductase [Catenulispora yoronensis]
MTSGGATALINAVTPFTAPPDSFDDFDADYYAKLVDNLGQAAATIGSRVIEIGLFAMLRTGDTRVFEDPAAFPAFLRPFAEARLRGLNAWHENQHKYEHEHGYEHEPATGIDWLILTPPPGLSPQAPPTGRYRLGDDTLAPEAATPLSYADLALAVLDQIDIPTIHRRQTAVYGLA